MLGAAFCWPMAALAPSSPPLCRVTATYRTTSWPIWAKPEDRLRQITVRLRPGCPEDGLARVSFRNSYGRTLPESGYYVLTPQFPILRLPGGADFSAVWPDWKVRWHAGSGRLYTVQQTQGTP